MKGNYTHAGISADPASCSACQASSSRERVWSPVGARGANGSSRRTAATREKSSLLRVQLAAGGGVSGGMARPAPDRWASSGSSTAGGSRRGGCGAAGPPGGGHGPQFHFTAAEGLLSEHMSAAGMPCCEHSTPPPGPVLFPHCAASVPRAAEAGPTLVVRRERPSALRPPARDT